MPAQGNAQAGHGVVVTRDGAIEGELLLDRRARVVEVDGRPRLRRLINGIEGYEYRARRRRAIPLTQVKRIDWHEPKQKVAA